MTVEEGSDLFKENVQRGLIADQMVEQLQRQPATVLGIERYDEAQQRRLGEVEPMLARIEALLELLGHGPVVRIEHELRDGERGAAAHHLRGRRQPLPVEGRAQDVVTVDDLLERGKVAVEQRALGKG